MILFTVLFSLSSYSVYAQASGAGDSVTDQIPATPTDPSTTPVEGSHSWPSDLLTKLSSQIVDEIDNSSVKLTYAIFDAVVEQELFSKRFDSGLDISAKVDRDIYYNSDIYSSYSVVDFFQIPVSLPLSYSAEIPSNVVSAGISFSTSLNLNMYNIRQVKPKNLTNIPEINKLSKDVQYHIHEAAVDSSDDDTVREPPRRTINWSQMRRYILIDDDNPLQTAMYGKLWNLLINPLRLPFTKKNFEKMSKQEIFSYGLNGTVQLGASTGWSKVVYEGWTPQFGVGISTYLTGQFRVSIMKEGENQALLKLSKISERGVNGFFGSHDREMTLFKGFSVLSFDEIGKLDVKVIPFAFTANHRVNRTIDVAYRYDLTKPEAWKAYTSATKGMMKRSEDLAKIEGSGVTRAFDRNRVFNESSSSYRMSLFLVFDKVRNTRARFSHAKIRLPQGDYKIFKAVSETSRYYDLLFLGKEQKSYNFTLTINEEEFYRQRSGYDFRVIMKAFDSQTTGKELRRYIGEVENVTGVSDVFPDVPLYEPIPEGVTLCSAVDILETVDRHDEHCYTPKSIDYEQSEFSYRLQFNSKHMQHFLNMTSEELWASLEKGFNVKEGVWSKSWKRIGYQLLRSPLVLLNLPLRLADIHVKEGNKFFAALKFYRNWKRLKKLVDPNLIVKRFSKLFRVNYYSKEYLYSFIYAVGRSSKMEFRGKNSNLFGTVSRGNLEHNSLDELAARDEVVFNFDRIGGRDYNIDHNSNLKAFNAKIVDKDNVNITVELGDKLLPKYIYFRLDHVTFFNYSNLTSGVVLNTDILKPGKNVIKVNRYDRKGLLGKLARYLFTGQTVLISVAVGQDGSRWGTLYQSKIKTIAPEPAQEPVDQ